MSFYFQLKNKVFPPDKAQPRDFTPQFRLEGRSRDANNPDALAMRTADPLWMLGRQWQFGEFQAEDNGSPISVDAHYRKEKPKHYGLGNWGPTRELGTTPLEARVEAMEVSTHDLKSKVRIGQQFERFIRKAFSQNQSIAQDAIEKLRGPNGYPLTIGIGEDNASKHFFKLMSGKVIDGGQLMAAINANKFPASDEANLQGPVDQLKRWYAELFVAPTSDTAWNQNHLDHEFEVRWLGDREEKEADKVKKKGEAVYLFAPDYQSGHLDWYSFDQIATDDVERRQELRLIEGEEFRLNTKATGLTPVNVSFSSMPNKRLFSFEDNQIDLSQMNVDSADLVKMMLLDFSLVSGSDWFTIPLEMEVGELCWVEKIEVTDVFGVITTIENDGETGAILDPDPLKTWDVFKIRDRQVSNYDATKHCLYIAPAATKKQESEPLEELLFLRDEYANMVWAVEKQVPNAMGNAVDGFDLHLEVYGPFEPTEKETSSQYPKYKLATTTPSNWIPYLPKHINGNLKDIELHRAYMVRSDDTGNPEEEPKETTPLTHLAKEDVKQVREEAIPKAGVRLQLTKQRVRWTDGGTYVWMGRKVLTGRGEGSSGLRFDYLK